MKTQMARLHVAKQVSSRRFFEVACVLSLLLGQVYGAAAQLDPNKAILDNDRVMVWDVTLTRGQPVSIALPDTDWATLFVSDGVLRTTDSHGKMRTVKHHFGDATYQTGGRSEREELVSAAPARIIVVELKNHTSPVYHNESSLPAAFPRSGSKKVLENDRIVVWNYTFRLHKQTKMHYHDKDALVVYRYQGSIQSTTPDGKSTLNHYKAGEVRFNPGGRAHYEELVDGQQNVFVVELK
jgi:hypothetical protein